MIMDSRGEDKYVCEFALFSGRLCCMLHTFTWISYGSLHGVLGGFYPEVCQDITNHIVKWRAIRAIIFVHEA